MPAFPYVSRVNQIDASQLDEEIYSILKAQSAEVSKYCLPGLAGRWQPEIDALLKLIIWNYSLRNGNSTFGQQLLNLNYSNYNNKKAVLLLILTVLPRYMQERLAGARLSREAEKNERIKFYIDRVATFARLLAFLNLLAFLYQGNQPHVAERLLGISNASMTINKPREIGYSYMTRELLWHGLIELFTVGLPMVNLHYLKQRLAILWRRGESGKPRRAPPRMDLATKCPDCDQSPNLPRHAGCEHVFCYYCIKAHFTVDETFQCPACGEELRAADMKTLL